MSHDFIDKYIKEQIAAGVDPLELGKQFADSMNKARAEVEEAKRVEESKAQQHEQLQKWLDEYYPKTSLKAKDIEAYIELYGKAMNMLDLDFIKLLP